MNNLDKIKRLVEESKDFPNAVITYSFDLPEVKGITPTSFFGIPAIYDSNVPKATGANITYKLL